MSILSVKNISAAVQALQAGGAVAFPTDTFYALGVDAKHPQAIEKAFKIKRRQESQPMPVLISDHSQVAQIVANFGESARLLAQTFWPGPLTIILEAAPDVPESINAGSGALGIRMPANNTALALIDAFGKPITGTSANISGQNPTKDARSVVAALGNEIDVVVEGKCGNLSAPSTVIDLTADNPSIIRIGAISPADIASSTGIAIT